MSLEIDGSILQTIKKMLGINPSDDAFDTDILIDINSSFDRLNTLGIGPKEGFKITDETTTWTEYLTDGKTIESVKNYIFYSTKIMFDTSSMSSFVVDTYQKQIDKLEFLFTVKSDSILLKDEGETT